MIHQHFHRGDGNGSVDSKWLVRDSTERIILRV